MMMIIDRLTFSLHLVFVLLFLLQCLHRRAISYMHNVRQYSKSINYYSNPASMGAIIHDSYGGKLNPCNGHYQSKPGYWAKAISTTCFWLLGINLLFLLAHSSCSVLIRNVACPCKEGPFLNHLIEALAWLVMFLSTRSSSTQLRSPSYSSLLRVWWAASFLLSFYSFILHIQSLSTHSTSSSISDSSSDSSSSSSDSDSDSSTVSIDLWASMLSLPAVSFLAVVSVYGKIGHSEVSVRAEKSGDDGDYVSPYYSVGFLSRLTLSWLNPLLSVGAGKALEMRDIPHLASIDRAEAAYVKLKENWAKLSTTNYNRKSSSSSSTSNSSSRSDSSSSENSSRSSSGSSKSISSSRTSSSSSSSINSSSSISVSSCTINNSSSSSSDICSSISSGLGSNNSSSIISSSSDISSRSIGSIDSGSNRSIGSNDSSGMISNSTITTTATTTVTYSSISSSSSRNSSIGSNDSSSSISNNSSSSSNCCSDRSSGSSSSSSKSSSSPLGWAIALTFKREAAYTAIFAGVNILASYVGPYLLDDFVEYLNGRRRFQYEGYALASFFFLSKLIETLSQRQWHLGINLVGMRIRSSLTALLYWKGLRLGSCRNDHNSGEIINYIAFDVERIGDYSSYLHQIWILPLQIALALSILYRNVGLAACIATLVATLISIASNTPIVKLQERYQELLMVAKDERMRATMECLRSMRILKLQAWEKMYYKKLCKLRKMEYTCLQKAIYTQSAVSFVFSGAPIFVSVVSFGTCLVVGIPLTSGRVLSALATFRVLQEPLQNFPDLVAVIAQTRVSLDRLFGFLQEDELQKENNISHCIIDKLPAESCKLAIDIKEGEFSWNPPITCGLSTLSGINLSISKGMRVAVCGMVGSGKSSFLACLLGEIPRISGTAKICGRIAYVSQSAWIQTGIVQENILFGKSMDKSKYENVLRVCDLQKDLRLIAYGDQTMIGERGINLSGGQKQRVQLARALYQDADVYLLDDPFSALDAHTGSQLFKEYILGALAFKTVLYVTHQVEFLPEADLILVLRNGKIIQAGKYKELQQAGTDFESLVCAHNEAIKSMDVAKTIPEEVDARDSHANSIHIMNISNHHGGPQGCLEGKKKPFVRLRIEKKGFSKHKSKRKQIIQEEERAKGSVKFYVYWSYMTAAYKGVLVPVILLAQASYQLLQISSNWWMARASPASKGKPFHTGSVKLMLVYMALAFSSALCIFIRAVLVAIFGMKASQKLFTSMQKCLFRASMAFFDSTPTGRILNRVSVDQSVVDLDIPFKLSSFAATTIQLLGIVGVMTQVTWRVLFLFVPVAAACLWMQKYYMASAQELTRLVSIQKSPIIHHFGESISGIATIRGFKEERRFQRTMLSLIDLHARPYFHNLVAIEWLCLRMELLSTFIFAFMMFLLVSFAPGTVDASMAGLAVSYGLTLNARQSRWVLSLCKLQNKVISIERIQQYTCIPSEAPLVIEDSRPPTNWPSLGSVEFHQLKVRYSEKFPVVLHGVSCNFPGGKKIGVVGRTGSGKSTLIQSLFRMVEAMEGRILIDGLDIAKIGLHDLRSRLNIIPQDPTLFEGTMRSNLDPLGDHSDSEIWETLDKCQLGDVVRSKEGNLDTIVTENGVNWSVGQRQLVCLGRVLLRHTRILVLDEATASVDTATDGLVQRVIHNEFQDCTIITVAHRIPTIIDSDLVLVLSVGRIAEYNSPEKLLEDKSSLFFKLVSEYSLRSSSFSDAAYTNRGSFNKTPTYFQAPLL